MNNGQVVIQVFIRRRVESGGRRRRHRRRRRRRHHHYYYYYVFRSSQSMTSSGSPCLHGDAIFMIWIRRKHAMLILSLISFCFCFGLRGFTSPDRKMPLKLYMMLVIQLNDNTHTKARLFTLCSQPHSYKFIICNNDFSSLRSQLHWKFPHRNMYVPKTRDIYFTV